MFAASSLRPLAGRGKSRPSHNWNLNVPAQGATPQCACGHCYVAESPGHRGGVLRPWHPSLCQVWQYLPGPGPPGPSPDHFNHIFPTQ